VTRPPVFLVLVAVALAASLAGCGAVHRIAGGGGADPAPTAASRTPAAAAHASAPARAETKRGDALAEARSRAALESAEPYWPFREAELLRAANEPRESVESALAASLARDPNYVPALALLSQVDFAAGRHAEAIARLEPFKTPLPGVSESDRCALLDGLALHYDALGRSDLAAEILAAKDRGEAPSCDSPASGRVYLVLRGLGPDAAADPAARALKQDSDSAVNRNNFGITRLRAGDVEEAEKSFQRAIEIDPALPGPYYNLALLEKFYRLDAAAAARWLALYKERSSDDPDGVFAQIATGGDAR
jgi:tetratricopeptide (TPR) repeat protein